MWRKVKIILATFFSTSLFFLALYYAPFWGLPPESKNELEVLVEEYEQVAEAVRSRPTEDREKILQLINELKAVLKIGDRAYPFKEDACTEVDEDRIRMYEPEIRRVLEYNSRLYAILSDGFLLQDEDNPDYIDSPFFLLRSLFNYYMDAAILAATDGDPTQSTDIMLSMIPLVEGLLHTPVLMEAMTGVALSDVLGRSIIYLIPRLSDNDLYRLSDRLRRYPDAVETLLDAMRISFFHVSETWKDYRKAGSIVYRMGVWSAVEAKIVQELGFIIRERYWFIFLSTNRLKLYQAWHKDGAVKPPDFNMTILDDMEISPLTAIATPNWDALVGKARKADIRNNAVRRAIDAELSMRRTGKRKFVEMPYDDDRQLVLYDRYGCVIEKTKPETDVRF